MTLLTSPAGLIAAATENQLAPRWAIFTRPPFRSVITPAGVPLRAPANPDESS